jgi:predicted DNA-binding transcriptional regulator AlpA
VGETALTEVQAAQMLGVSPSLLRKMRSRDREAAPGARTGPRWTQITARRVVYLQSDVLAYREARRDERVWRW